MGSTSQIIGELSMTTLVQRIFYWGMVNDGLNLTNDQVIEQHILAAFVKRNLKVPFN